MAPIYHSSYIFKLSSLSSASKSIDEAVIDTMQNWDREFFPWPWREGELKKFREDPNHYIGVLQNSEGELLAFLLGSIQEYVSGDKHQFHLYKILTHPSMRRHGFGKELLKNAYHELLSLNVGEVYLEVAERNLAAVEFYLSLGLNIIHLKKNFYSDGSHANIMLGTVNINLFD